MKINLRVIFSILLFCKIAFSQWLPQPVPQNTSIFLSIDFLDNHNGISGGWFYGGDAYGRIAYTTNSGNNWFLSQIPDTIRSIVSIQFINSQLAYAAGAYNKYHDFKNYFKSGIIVSKTSPVQSPDFLMRTISDTSTRGVFLKSTDNGITWFAPVNINIDTFYYFEGMHFLDANTGYITGDPSDVYNNQHSVIIKTTDGGMNWIKFNLPDSLAYLRNIYFLNSLTGFAAGYYRVNDPVFGIQGAIIQTTDGGSNWLQNKFYYVNNFTSIVFANPSTGFACGVSNSDTIFRGIVYKTTNTGQNWFKLNFQLDTSLFEGINFVNNSGKGFVYGEEYKQDTSFPGNYFFENRAIVRTTDFGNTWFTQLFPDADNMLIGSCIIDPNNWYISGGQFALPGLILQTTNGGGPIGIEPISNIIPQKLFLHPAYPNPFNPVTIIKFDLPPLSVILMNGETKDPIVSINIYDVLGNQVAVLFNDQLKPGTYEINWNASNYSSGIYFLSLKTNGFYLSQKLVLIK